MRIPVTTIAPRLCACCSTNPSEVFPVSDIMNTPELRAEGMKWRARFNGLMLFSHEEPQPLEYTTRGLVIPIDMVFLDETWHVTAVFSNCAPNSGEREGFGKYVIEAESGWAKRNRLEEGSLITIFPC